MVFIAGRAVLLCFSSFADCFFPIQQRAQHPPIHPFADCIEPIVRLFAHLRHGSLFPALCARIRAADRRAFCLYSALPNQRPFQHAPGRLGDDGGDCRHAAASLRRVARRRQYRTAAVLYGGWRLDLLGQNPANAKRLQYRQTVEPQACCVYRVDFLFAVSVALGGLGRHTLCLHGQRFADVRDCIGSGADVWLVRFVLLLRRNTSTTDKEFHHQEIHRGNSRLFRPADSCRRLPADYQTGRIRGKPIYG